MDSLGMEDNQVDPYLLFTITDASDNVVRHIKKPAKKGMNRMTWDLRFAPPDPVVGRYTPAPDQLFGSGPEGHLVMPGIYKITMSKYQDGMLTTLAGPVSFTTKLLNQASLPAKDMAANVSFYKKVSDISKELSATNDKLNDLEERAKNAELAILDMPAPVGDLLTKTHDILKALIPLKINLFGDNTRSRREFETKPSINERVGTVTYSIWNTTSDIPQTFRTSLDIAVKQYNEIFPMIKDLDSKMSEIEKALNRNKAPYTPGRWPDKK